MNWAKLKNKYAIAGVGYTPQGKVPSRSALSFHVQACAAAIADAGIAKEDVGELLLYRHFAPTANDVDVTAFLVAEQLGIQPAVLSQEAYCTRTWLPQAIGLMEQGLCEYVLVSYGDNARSGHRAFVNELAGGEPTDEAAAFGDLSTLSKYALAARRAMCEYDTGPHVWKEIAVAQRAWACLNENAGMHGKPLGTEDYLQTPYLVEPFRMLDATPVTDGGRAIVLTTAQRAKQMKNPLVTIMGYGVANAPAAPQRQRLDADSCAAWAARDAFAMAGIAPKDVDACQIYDCFTYTVEATLRDYGFFRPQQAAEFLTSERLGPGGKLPVNTSGGMLSEAYFMGLTPVSEGVMQLMGRCGARQLGGAAGGKKPKIIVCSDNGGVFQSHICLVLKGDG